MKESDCFPITENFKKFVCLQPPGDYTTKFARGMIDALKYYCIKNAQKYPDLKDCIPHIECAWKDTKNGEANLALRDVHSVETSINLNNGLYRM